MTKIPSKIILLTLKRWSSAGIKRQANWDRLDIHTRNTGMLQNFSALQSLKRSKKMWVLLGASWPKLTIMSIFCDVMPQNGRHNILCKKRNIHDLAAGQWILCDVVQSLTSPFFPPHMGAEPGRAKRESRITCMRMLRTPPFPPPQKKNREKNHIWK